MHKKQIQEAFDSHTQKRWEDEQLLKDLQYKLEDEIKERRKMVTE